MENASKALLIAAAVLIVIILIGFGMIILNSTQDTVKDAQGVGSSISDASQSAVGKLETAFNKGGTTGTNPIQPTVWHDNGDGSYTKGDKKVNIGDTFTNGEVLLATGGDESSYKGDWIVLGLENGKLKLVSTENVVEDVKLGIEDPNAPSNLEEIFNQEGENNLNVEKAIWSYNNVVSTNVKVGTLDAHAKDATGIASARSITIEDIDTLLGRSAGEGNDNYRKEYEYRYEDGGIYSYVNDVKNGGGIFTFIDNNKNIIDSYNSGQIIKLKSDYYGYSFSTNEKNNYSYITNTSKGYWLASPCVACDENYATFRVRNVRDGRMYYPVLFSSTGRAHGYAYGVRAVVYI